MEMSQWNLSLQLIYANKKLIFLKGRDKWNQGGRDERRKFW
jgi:hypothetical protein